MYHSENYCQKVVSDIKKVLIEDISEGHCPKLYIERQMETVKYFKNLKEDR